MFIDLVELFPVLLLTWSDTNNLCPLSGCAIAFVDVHFKSDSALVVLELLVQLVLHRESQHESLFIHVYSFFGVTHPVIPLKCDNVGTGFGQQYHNSLSCICKQADGYQH